jgi:hypothetical protein
MARDYTKYSVEGLGENLNKRQLVYTIVKDFIEKNNPTLESLLITFPDELQGSKGVVRKESDVDDPTRFNMKAPLKIKNGMHVVVSNQWGDNIPGFIEVAEKLSYSIQQISGNDFTTSDENINVNIAAKLISSEEYGETFGYVDLELTLNSSLIKEIEIKSNYLNLTEIINEIHSNYIEEIITEMDNQSGLGRLKDSDFDWFNYAPQLVITQINAIDLRAIHDYYLNENQNLQVAQILDIEEDEIDDYVSDFIQSTRYEISKVAFDKISNSKIGGLDISKEDEENNNDQLGKGDFIKLNRFELEIPFPNGIEIIEISVANSNEKMWQDLGERIIVHYDVINNAIVKHNNHEEEPIFEYLDVWEAEIPETYVDLTEWLGDIYFSGQINGNDWNVSYHGGYIEDRLNISEEMEKILFQNFSEKNMYRFIDEILNLVK